MQANGQCQQAGPLQLTHPHLNYNASASNRGYENNSSYDGVGARVGHYPIHNVGVKQQSAQRRNNFLALNNPSTASSHQNYYPNSTQITANQNNTPTFSLNQQVMFAKKPWIPGNSQSASNMPYYQSHFKLQKTCVNSRTGNVSIQMTNPSTSSTMQHMSYTQQSAVQNPMYSQTSQQAVSAPYAPPPYSQNVNVAFSNVPVLDAQNAQIYSISPVALSTSCFNEVAANNQSAQNNYFVSKTNNSCSVNDSTPLSILMVPNNTDSQTNSLTAVPVQTQYASFQGQKQTSVRGNINMQITQPDILSPNDNDGLNTLSALLTSQTYLQKNGSAAPLQTTKPTKDQSFHQVGNSLFYQKMNDVFNSSSLCLPLNQASDLSRCETSAKDKDNSLQVSPGRAARAVAVVLPLSQESSPSKHPSPSSLPSSNPAPGSCFFTSKHLDKAPVQTIATSYSNISDKANAQTPSPSRDEIQLSAHDAGTKLSTLRLTFAQLVEGKCRTKLSGQQKSKSGNKKAPKEQKLREPSSLPTTEWTLKMLYEKILELEKKGNEHESDNIPDKCESLKKLVHRFWNGDCKALVNEAKTGRLSKEMTSIRNFCSKIDIDTVILSQNQSNHSSRYHVLLHDEVYAEKTSYTSSWLNVKRLDDIDEEFGLPCALKYGNRCKSVDAEPKHKIEGCFKAEVKSANPKSEECKNEAEEKDDPSKMLPTPISSIPLVNSLSNNTDEENHNFSAHSHLDPEERVEENECVPNAQLDDSSYSFKIEVLHPEEAKVIFEQTECDIPQMADAAISEEIPQSDQDGAESQTCHVSTLEKICCIEKWKENVFGLSSDGKCKCKEDNQNEEKLGQFENKNCWLMGTVDLTEDDDFPLLATKSENIQEDESPNKTTIRVSSESEDESQVPETQTDPHNEHEEDLVISTESQLDEATNEHVLENSNGGNTNNHILDSSNVTESEMTTSDESLGNVWDCRKDPEVSGDEMANPASSQLVCTRDNVKENNKRIASDIFGPLLHPSKKPKLSTHLKSQTIFESFAKCRNSKRVETAELALFGSSHKKCASDGSQQSHVRSSQTNAHALFGKTEEAPRRLYIKFSTFTKSDKQEAEPSGNLSVKERVHEKWRKSFPLTTIRLKKKNKKFAIVGGTHGRTIHLRRNKHKDKCVTPKRKTQDSDGQFCEKTSCNDGKSLNMLKKPDEVRPLQENALKFNVLPNTFNFKEGSNDTDCRTYSKADEETVPAEGNPLVIKTKGVWCDDSTSSPAPVPESTGLFQEFQRRYKMRQASTDE